MDIDNWVTLAIILVVMLAAGLLIYHLAPNAISTWFNGFLNTIFHSVPTN